MGLVRPKQKRVAKVGSPATDGSDATVAKPTVENINTATPRLDKNLNSNYKIKSSCSQIDMMKTTNVIINKTNNGYRRTLDTLSIQQNTNDRFNSDEEEGSNNSVFSTIAKDQELELDMNKLNLNENLLNHSSQQQENESSEKTAEPDTCQKTEKSETVILNHIQSSEEINYVLRSDTNLKDNKVISLNIQNDVSEKHKSSCEVENIVLPLSAQTINNNDEKENSVVSIVTANHELENGMSKLTLDGEKNNATELECGFTKLTLNETEDEESDLSSSGLTARGRVRNQDLQQNRVTPYSSQCHIDRLHCGGVTVLQNNFVEQQNYEQQITPTILQGHQLPGYAVESTNQTYIQQTCADETNSFQNSLISPEEFVKRIQDPDEMNFFLSYLHSVVDDSPGTSVVSSEYIPPPSGNTASSYYSPVSRRPTPPPSIDDVDEVINNTSFNPQLEEAIKEEINQVICQAQSPSSMAPNNSFNGFVSCVSMPPTPPGDELSPVGSPASGITIVPAQNTVIKQTPQSTVLLLVSTTPSSTQMPQQPAAITPQRAPRQPQIKPGHNLPPLCSESARDRLKSYFKKEAKETKDKLWAWLCAQSDEFLLAKNNEGNTILSWVLSNCSRLHNFPAFLYTSTELTIDAIKRKRNAVANATDAGSQMFQGIAADILATPNNQGLTPLDLACENLQGSRPDHAIAFRYLVEVMLDMELNVNGELDSEGNTLLHKICKLGDCVQYIMAELLSMKDPTGKPVFDVNKKNNAGETPLHVAARRHRTNNPRDSCAVLAQLLVKEGASPAEKEGCGGNNVLHYVARESCDPNLILILLAHTQNVKEVVNEKNYNKDTPLHMVAANNSVEKSHQYNAARHIVDYGAQPQALNGSGNAPLSLVARDRKQDVRAILYRKKADSQRQADL